MLKKISGKYKRSELIVCPFFFSKLISNMLKKSIFLSLNQLLKIGVTHLSMGFTKSDMLAHYQSILELYTFMFWYYKIFVSIFIMELKHTSNKLNLVSIGLYCDKH